MQLFRESIVDVLGNRLHCSVYQGPSADWGIHIYINWCDDEHATPAYTLVLLNGHVYLLRAFRLLIIDNVITCEMLYSGG